MEFLKWLGFGPEKHSVRTEILAGLTTFLTMAYIPGARTLRKSSEELSLLELFRDEAMSQNVTSRPHHPIPPIRPSRPLTPSHLEIRI